MALGRPTKARAVRREALREELKSREYLRQIHKILNDELATEGLEQTETLRLKARLSGYFNLLSKTLPDVKAVEIDAVMHEAPKDRAELENALRSVGVDPRLIASAGDEATH